MLLKSPKWFNPWLNLHLQLTQHERTTTASSPKVTQHLMPWATLSSITQPFEVEFVE
jgi:hypothetical protein